MLFDLEDYITGGVIGPNDGCLPCETYEDMRVTASQTRDAYFKSLTEWYEASTCCLSPNDPCLGEIQARWSNLGIGDPPSNLYAQFLNIWEKFWDSLKCDGTFSDDICNQYRKIMVDLKCLLKELLRLVDGDYLNNTPIPVTVTEPCPDILTLTLTPITSTTSLVNGIGSEACCTKEVVRNDVKWDGSRCIAITRSTTEGLDTLVKTR
jgi:hypothetical protein